MAKSNPAQTQDSLEVFITVLVCAFITTKFADVQVQWNLVVKKATAWVNKEIARLGLQVDFGPTARSVLTSVGVITQ